MFLGIHGPASVAGERVVFYGFTKVEVRTLFQHEYSSNVPPMCVLYDTTSKDERVQRREDASCPSRPEVVQER